MTGWLKLHRSIITNKIFENERLLKVFVWTLCKATHKEYDQLIGLKSIKLYPGQFITGRNKAALELKLPPSTVWDHLKTLENLETIRIESTNKYSKISIVNWDLYQVLEKNSDSTFDTYPDNKTDNNKTLVRIEDTRGKGQIKTKPDNKSNSKPTTTRHKQEYKEYIYSIVEQVIDHLNIRTGKSYRATTPKTISLIESRLNEGFEIDDIMRVIDIKTEQWIEDSKMKPYLRPETLFGNKFESYLNESPGEEQGFNWRGSDRRL